jgi:anti-sigma-K factor RskA
MSKDQRPDSSLSAEYALGLLRGGERSAVEADTGLRNEAEDWQKKLAPLDGADGEPVPPGSFEKILARIDDEGMPCRAPPPNARRTPSGSTIPKASSSACSRWTRRASGRRCW